MSFNIGTRVKSQFCGEGTVTSGIIPDVEFGPKRQMVKFDASNVGEISYPIGRLDRVGEDGA